MAKTKSRERSLTNASRSAFAPNVLASAACLDQMLHWHESYFDGWPLGRLIHALGGAGLALERLEELPDPNRWGRREVRVPGDLIVVARKP